MPHEPILDRSEVRWPDSRRGPWTIRIHWASVGDRPECVGLELWKGCGEDDGSISPLPGTSPGRIEAGDLRRIPLGQVIADERAKKAKDEARGRHQAAAIRSKMADEELEDPERQIVARWLETVADLPPYFDKRVGGRYPADHWRNVAEVYSAAWRGGRNPTEAVAEAFGLPYSTAAKHVARARAEGHLGRVSRGRPGGITKKRRAR